MYNIHTNRHNCRYFVCFAAQENFKHDKNQLQNIKRCTLHRMSQRSHRINNCCIPCSCRASKTTQVQSNKFSYERSLKVQYSSATSCIAINSKLCFFIIKKLKLNFAVKTNRNVTLLKNAEQSVDGRNLLRE